MMDFKIDSDGDVIISDGKFELLTTIQEAVRQRLSIGLKTFLGEYFLDTTVGIPYRQQIFNKNITPTEVDALFLKYIYTDDDVIKVVSFDSTYNQYTRKYDLDFEVLTTDGLLRVSLPNITTNDEVEYLAAGDFVVSPSCNLGNIYSAGTNTIITPASSTSTPSTLTVFDTEYMVI